MLKDKNKKEKRNLIQKKQWKKMSQPTNPATIEIVKSLNQVHSRSLILNQFNLKG
jgi:hypothetical protein